MLRSRRLRRVWKRTVWRPVQDTYGLRGTGAGAAEPTPGYPAAGTARHVHEPSGPRVIGNATVDATGSMKGAGDRQAHGSDMYIQSATLVM